MSRRLVTQRCRQRRTDHIAVAGGSGGGQAARALGGPERGGLRRGELLAHGGRATVAEQHRGLQTVCCRGSRLSLLLKCRADRLLGCGHEGVLVDGREMALLHKIASWVSMASCQQKCYIG